jgi:aromatic ring-opening dioxygenase LigB subunit
MIVAYAIAPHSDLDDAPATRGGMEAICERVASAVPESIVVVTPHDVHVEGHFAVVVSAHVGERAVDRELAHGVLAELRARRVPAVGVSFGGNDPDEAEMPLDWGTEIPLAFLPDVPAVVVSPARDRPLKEHVVAGEAIEAAAGGKRIALIASADHGHAHDVDGPYGFDPAAAEYDERILRAVRENTLADLLELGDLAARAKADSLWQLIVLHGALGTSARLELLSYEVPSYYRMLCAVAVP